MMDFIEQEWSYILCESPLWIREYIVKLGGMSIGYMNAFGQTLTRTVKPTHLSSEPGSSRAISMHPASFLSRINRLGSDPPPRCSS